MTAAPTRPADPEALYAFLAAHGIACARFDHAPAFTCDDVARSVPAEAAGVQTKNLFLRDHRGRRHWLLVTSCDTPVDLRALAPRIGADRISFASPERLARFLGVTPGAVTVLGLVHDAERAVELVVDRAVWDAEAWRCHPLTNAATVVLSRADVERFLRVTGHAPRVVDL
jgi:Ala-tRNA(Pro) deacylase